MYMKRINRKINNIEMFVRRMFAVFLSMLIVFPTLNLCIPTTTVQALNIYRSVFRDLVNTTTEVYFNDIAWYIIEDNSTATRSGTVTLLAKDPFCAMEFKSSYDDKVGPYLRGLTAKGGSFENVAGAIVDTEVSESRCKNKLYIPSFSELKGSQFSEVRKCSQASGSSSNFWWKRDKASNGNQYITNGDTGNAATTSNTTQKYGVRPALKLQLEYVTFSSETRTFTEGSWTVTFRVQDGKWDDGTTADKVVTLAAYGSLKLAADDIPEVGGKPDVDYKAGFWAPEEPQIDTVITKNTSFTYCYDYGDYCRYIPRRNDDATALADKIVRFNNLEWYIIADNSSGIDSGVLFLFAKEPMVALEFSDPENIRGTSYNKSAVRAYLRDLYDLGGEFEDVAMALFIDNSSSWDGIRLLSKEEVQQLPEVILSCTQAEGAYDDSWWLSTVYEENKK